jgi:integrase
MWAENHYRREDGSQTNQLVEYKYTLKPLRKLYGHTKAKDFGPLALKTVREKMIEAQWCRNQINSRVGKIKRVFRWATSEQLIPVGVYTALATVAGLQRGRTSAPESEPVGPVDPGHVSTTLLYLNRHVAGLVTFQRLTGCRPGEAVLLRRCDIDTSREVWFFTPQAHKTKHKGKSRTIAIGPRAQALLAQFFTADHQAYLFDPRRAVEEHHAKRAANRRTPFYPSSIRHKKKTRVKVPLRKPAGRYTTHAYSVAVRRAVERVNHVYVEAAVELELHILHWHPNQLRHTFATEVRHTFATEVRKRHGLEHAGAALGHTKMSATQVHAERDQSLAARIAAEMG